MIVCKRSVLAGALILGTGVAPMLSPRSGAAEQFSYSHIEIAGDISRTQNTARGASGNAPGSSFGIEISYDVFDSVYLRGAVSTEDKNFENDVFGFGDKTKLNTSQRFVEAGLGVHTTVARKTGLYAEVIAMHSRVEHDLPCVYNRDRSACHKLSEPEAGPILGAYFGALQAPGPPPPPPGVSKVVGVLSGSGWGAKLGLRYRLTETTELEAGFRWNSILDEEDRTVELGLRFRFPDRLDIGAAASFARSTDRNFDDIGKLTLSARYRL